MEEIELQLKHLDLDDTLTTTYRELQTKLPMFMYRMHTEISVGQQKKIHHLTKTEIDNYKNDIIKTYHIYETDTHGKVVDCLFNLYKSCGYSFTKFSQATLNLLVSI